MRRLWILAALALSAPERAARWRATLAEDADEALSDWAREAAQGTGRAPFAVLDSPQHGGIS